MLFVLNYTIQPFNFLLDWTKINIWLFLIDIFFYTKQLIKRKTRGFIDATKEQCAIFTSI